MFLKYQISILIVEKIKSLVAFLMMVLQPQACIPSSIKRNGSGYNFLKEINDEVAVCRDVTASIATAILKSYPISHANAEDLHQSLMGILNRGDLGYLTEAHFASANQLLKFM